ncbi:SDH family Clp fold serine proteinase [Pectobacterium aroidearum]|uniref:SDH family Clp fold serine proteinase n=1 Tax=Pectobacterium aroidearum TaxID=1201031 RepID=UPI003306CA00
MYQERINLYRQLEQRRESKLITYVTGDRPGLETQIHAEIFDLFVNHLDLIGVVPKITLLLYTRGGDTLTAWSLVNLLRQFCDELEIIIPSKCHSAGTLMALGANKIVMTKQSTLGPIDPSVTTPLNPVIVVNNQNTLLPVSVEEIKGYIAVAKEEMGISDGVGLSRILSSLSDKVHPLVLGKVYRAKSQIQMLASRLLAHQIRDQGKIDHIVNFLCSDSGSHDYTISRREAESELGLTIEKPDQSLYELIKLIYEDIKTELKLGEPFDANAALGPASQLDYQFIRGILESPDTFSYQHRTDGNLSRVQIGSPPQFGINNNVIFQGWKRHDIQ